MPTLKRRLYLTLEDDMVKTLERHRNRLSIGRYASVSSAAVDLIQRGIDALAAEQRPAAYKRHRLRGAQRKPKQ